MKKLRPWLYFLLFMVVFATLSILSDTDFYIRYAWWAGLLWMGAVIVLSVVTLHQWWQHHTDPTDVGFGWSALPLPRSWKRWIYDEPKNGSRSD